MEHDVLCAALVAEGVIAEVGYQAMHHYPLFQPRNSKLAVPNAFPECFDFNKMSFPEAERACEHEAISLDEATFRAGRQGVDDVVTALKKVHTNARELKQAAEAWKTRNK
jgi:hypothetical protein